MAKPWNELRDRMTPERQVRSAAHSEAMLLELRLAEVRRTRNLTQVQVAQAMQTDQASVSKLEHREDLYLSTLRGYVQALGGELKLVASFPDAEIQLTPVTP
jgi:transcriptional regulator with XRE-family HTH domain